MAESFNVKNVLDKGICVGAGWLYYEGINGAVCRCKLENRTALTMEGVNYNLISDGIKNKEIASAIEEHKRSASKFATKNLEQCMDLCGKYLGKPLTQVVNSYKSWLHAIERRKENLNKARDAYQEKHSTPESLAKYREEKKEKQPREADSARMARMKAMNDKIKKDFDGRIKYCAGIIRQDKDGFEFHYNLDAQRMKPHEVRRAWVFANAKTLAKYAFTLIRNEPTWARKLETHTRYIPGNVSVSAYGDVYIEFTAKRPSM